jgi:hypothetical protein
MIIDKIIFLCVKDVILSFQSIFAIMIFYNIGYYFNDVSDQLIGKIISFLIWIEWTDEINFCLLYFLFLQ